VADAPNDQNGYKKFLPNGEKPMAPQMRRRMITIAVIAFILGLLIINSLFSHQNVKTITYSALLRDAKSQSVDTAAINNSSGVITGQLTSGVNYTANGPVPALSTEVNTLRTDNVSVTFANPSSLAADLLPYLIWILIFVGFLYYASRQARGQMNGMMSVGRSKAKQFNEDRPKTTFADVAGYLGVKQEISEVVEFLKNPIRYKTIGATIPKGILLVGPPGTGKTMLARAVAGEAGVPFFSVSGSDFMEMFVGVGASRVRDLFNTARKQSPAIVFVDEIDSIGRKRGAGLGGGHDEREQTLNQMLSEMDGFEPTEGVVVIAATNRPDVLDPALLRPGRFDRQIVVPLPDLEERLPILEVHSKGKPLDPTVDLSLVARGTPGMSGADLANLVNEAALHAVRRNSSTVSMEDFESARDRVLMGQERDTMVIQDDERERIAFHESGHALLAYVLEKTDPLHKITIIPRGMALGVTMTLPEEDRHIMSREHLEDSLCMRMGGRVAELLVYGDLSTGAADDLQRNTELARRMVREWGMSKEIGPMAWGSNNQVFLGEDLMHTRDYSDHTSKVIDDEIERILREQESRAIEVLTLHRRGLEALTRALIEHETIDGAEAARLIDEANGEPVHPAGTKTVSALHGVGRAATSKEPTPVAAAPTPPPNWQPPSLPAI
jgi:cell division protease FtsH